MEAGHKNNIPRGLEADDALLLAFVLDGSASFFLRDLRGAASTPSRDNFQICSPSSRLHRIKPALCGHWQEGDV